MNRHVPRERPGQTGSVSMPTAGHHLNVTEIPEAECRQLVEDHGFVGRIAWMGAEGIELMPVNYIADSDAVVFATAPSVRDRIATASGTVVFEVDASYPLEHSGWSVVIRGHASEITGEIAVERLGRGRLRSWAGPVDAVWMSISIEKMTGRRIPEH